MSISTRKTILVGIAVGVLLSAGAASAALVGHYQLDDNYLDSSGNVYDGTLVLDTDGSPSEVYAGPDRLGNPSGAMWWPALTGIPHAGADYIDTGAPATRPLYNDTGSMSVAAWVYLNPDIGGIPWSTTNYQSTIATKMGGSGSRDWMFAVENQVSGGTLPSTQYSLRLRVATNGTTLASAYDTAELPINQWVHVVGVYEAGPTPSIKLYVNADERMVGTTGTIPTARFNGTQSVKIGNRDALVQQWWKGGIDDLRIYNHALTQEEITAIYVPEPAALALLGFGSLLMVRRRR